MSHPQVTRATPAARERVVDTVVAAFSADPAFRFFFPDDTSYGDQAARFAGHLFDRRAPHGTIWIVEGGASVAMWDPPFAADLTPEPPALEPPVLEPPALELPGATVARLAAYDAAIHTALPPTAHWYLGVLATHPTHTARGWGRAVMTAGLADAAPTGLPAYLETANPDNVEMYRRTGWEVTEFLTVQTLRVWIMRYLAPSAVDGRRDAQPRGSS